MGNILKIRIIAKKLINFTYLLCYGSGVSGTITKLVLCVLRKCVNMAVLGTRVLTVVRERDT